MLATHQEPDLAGLEFRRVELRDLLTLGHALLALLLVQRLTAWALDQSRERRRHVRNLLKPAGQLAPHVAWHSEEATVCHADGTLSFEDVDGIVLAQRVGMRHRPGAADARESTARCLDASEHGAVLSHQRGAGALHKRAGRGRARWRQNGVLCLPVSGGVSRKPSFREQHAIRAQLAVHVAVHLHRVRAPLLLLDQALVLADRAHDLPAVLRVAGRLLALIEEHIGLARQHGVGRDRRDARVVEVEPPVTAAPHVGRIVAGGEAGAMVRDDRDKVVLRAGRSAAAVLAWHALSGEHVEVEASEREGDCVASRARARSVVSDVVSGVGASGAGGHTNAHTHADTAAAYPCH